MDLIQNPSQSASFLDSVSLSRCSVERRGDPSRGRWPVQARDTVERRVLTAWFQRDGRTLIRPCPDGNGYYSNEERPSGESTNNDRTSEASRTPILRLLQLRTKTLR